MRAPYLLLVLLSLTLSARAESELVTTAGAISESAAGLILPHEHIFTDLRGPDKPGYGEAAPAEVIRVMKPLLEEAKRAGVSTIIECTTIGVGRNVPIIKRLASETGLNIVVPTGVYGRANFAPKKYTAMSENELAQWMMIEIVVGIENTGVRAGFIKTAASENELRPIELKFLRASCRAALQTGVTIASHTTSGAVARIQLDVLKSIGLKPERFVWVHAQAEANTEIHKELAQRGAYVELDSIGNSQKEDEKILKIVQSLKSAGLLSRVLLSHDAGWYNPGQPKGGKQRGYTALTATFIPKLKQSGFTSSEIHQLTHENPFRAFARTLPEQNLEKKKKAAGPKTSSLE
jgi:phosphotriesterase-related protein